MMDDYTRGLAHAIAVIEIWRDNYAAAGKADKVQAFEALRQNLEDNRAEMKRWAAPSES